MPSSTAFDAKRRAEQPWRGWYQTLTWKGIRAKRRREEPLCRMCASRDVVRPARHVDHVKAHRGDWALFSDYANTQHLCDHHHNSVKQSHERGRKQAIGVDGWPTE